MASNVCQLEQKSDSKKYSGFCPTYCDITLVSITCPGVTYQGK